VKSGDGSLLRVPDTPANRAAFGSAGTAGDSAAWPCVRLFPLNDCLTRFLLAMPWGPAGTDKTASEQQMLDAVIRDYPHVPGKDQVWLLDRLWHGTGRLAALAERTHVLVRLKSDIPLNRTSVTLPDGSYRAEISGDGITMEVRVIEYGVHVEGQKVEEMFCLITSLLDWEDYRPSTWPGSINGGGTARRPRCGKPRRRCTAPGRAPGRCSAPTGPS
jgi:hypothetical protein